MDPPFTVDEIFDPVLECVACAEILDEDGILSIRTRKGRTLADEVGRMYKFKEKTYGQSTIHFYQYYALEEDEQ